MSQGNNRLVLLLIAGIPVTMILAATWLWYFVARGELDLVGMVGTANRGQLLQPPRAMDDVALYDEYGAPLPYADLEPRWSLVIPNAGACGTDCERSLYLTRQIHVALGKEFNRIRRIYVSEATIGQTELSLPALSDGHAVPQDFATLLSTEHRGLLPLRLEAGGMDILFAEYGQHPGTWYLVDPAGWVIMSYNEGIQYKDVIADLKFLLKNSSI